MSESDQQDGDGQIPIEEEPRFLFFFEQPDPLTLWIYGVFGVVLIALMAIFLTFIRPAPPAQVTIAAGSKEGAYWAFAQHYRERLARNGIDLVVLETNGTVENLGLLTAPGSSVDVAFVQSGVAAGLDLAQSSALVALGSLYYEPLWIFHRSDVQMEGLVDLAGQRLAVGADGSGTQAIARELLSAVGIDMDAPPTDALIVRSGGTKAAAALLENQVDAGFFIVAPGAGYIRQLIESADVQLFSFDRAEAFARNYRYLSPLTLPEGALDLGRNYPARDVALVSPVATLVAQHDLHPAVIDLLLLAAGEIHGAGRLFEAAGEFPSPRFVDFPLSEDARRFFERGAGFWRRFLPFWLANLVDRFIVFAIPLAALGLPLVRMVAPTYRWQVRRRIYRYYQRLRAVERALVRAQNEGELRACINAIRALQDDAGQVKVPDSYTSELYHLRMHAQFLENLLLNKLDQG